MWEHICNFIVTSVIYLWAGAETIPLLLWPFIGLLFPSLLIDGDDCGAVSGINEWYVQYSESLIHRLSWGHLKWIRKNNRCGVYIKSDLFKDQRN
jgi:hypothetical protein